MANLVMVVLLLCAWLSIASPTSKGLNPNYTCPTTKCTRKGPQIRFPFRLNTQPPACGLPGPSFELSCMNHKTLLRLQSSPALQVHVVSINYKNSLLSVSDAGGCLPNLIFNFNPSASPFNLTSDIYNPVVGSFVFFYCSPSNSYFENGLSSTNTYFENGLSSTEDDLPFIDPFIEVGSKIYVAPCMSSSAHSIWYMNAHDQDLSLVPPPCHTTKTVESPRFYLEQVRKSYSSRYLVLTWDLPKCRVCENQGQRCGFKNQTTTETRCFEDDHTHQGDHKKKLIIGLVVGLSSFVLIMISVGYKAYQHIEEGKMEGEYQRKIELFLEDYKSLRPARYSYKEIKKMTSNFSIKLGQGGYGSVFKGQLPNGVLVAVKLLKNSGGDGNEFINEVGTIGRIHHVNIVRLLGFCVERLKRALIYEFMPNESLEKYIFSNNGNGPLLGWEKVAEIAIGIARGIEYLHQGCDQCILHFDIKPHNILLDQNFIPKISDFGLAKLCTKDQSVVSMTAARGTMGYIAPEVFSRNFGNVSYKSDIFSFGMLLLEMVGGKKSIDMDVDQTCKPNFSQWIYRRILEDGDLGFDHNIGGQLDGNISNKLTIVALWCIQWNSVDRPSITGVLQMLEGGLDALILPSNPFDAASHEAQNVAQIRSQLSVISE